ncbi:MAG: AAA family ATPase [Lachnospiraceae bacterium]
MAKGGCGKSTVTSLLSKALARRGKETLVIDSDESNYGLHRQLGMKLPRDFTDYFGGKQNVLNNMMLSKFTHQFFEETWTIDDIPEDYYSLKDDCKTDDQWKKFIKANEGCSLCYGNCYDSIYPKSQAYRETNLR